MTDRKLRDGEVRRYVARVHDLEGDHPKHAGDWFRVKTTSNPMGEYTTRRAAKAALERAIASYPHGKLAGHVDDVIVDKPLTLDNVKIDKWLKGDVVPIREVPKQLRGDYEDTLRRAALASARYGSPVYVSDSFRSRELQQQRWEAYLAGGPLAARPGTSDHERGLSLDIPNARNTPALIRELRKLEMIDDVASEQWHVTNMARKRG
jgi:D-alanyl-D-alanine carboxypeptidase